MAAHVVPDDASRLESPSLRLILDTNVVSRALRWMAADKRPPDATDLDAIKLVQRVTAQRKLRARVHNLSGSTAFDLRLAALEGSRDVGALRSDRLARMAAASDVLADWLYEGRPLNGRTFAKRPDLIVDAESFALLDGAREYVDHSRVVLALLGLEAIYCQRVAGELRNAVKALQVLQEWEASVRGHVVLSPVMLLIGVQVALGRLNDAAASMCKFGAYRDLESARRTAWNAAWDLTFMRVIGASEHGAFPYADRPMPAVLVTSDRALARTVTVVGPTFGVNHPVTGRRLTGSVLNLEPALRGAHLRDDKFMEMFRAWVADSTRAQRQRSATETTFRRDEETDELVQQALRERFAASPG